MSSTSLKRELNLLTSSWLLQAVTITPVVTSVMDNHLSRPEFSTPKSAKVDPKNGRQRKRDVHGQDLGSSQPNPDQKVLILILRTVLMSFFAALLLSAQDGSINFLIF